MSSKKITAADKLEIASLYRQAGDTTASLANRYGVSSSTISRLLKASIPEAEYEMLIQQKRGLKVGIEEEILTTTAASIASNPTPISVAPDISYGTTQPNFPTPDPEAVEEDSSVSRRLRRRSSAPSTVDDEAVNEIVIDTPKPISSAEVFSTSNNIDLLTTNQPEKIQLPPPISRTPVLREILADSENRYATPIVEPSSFAGELEDDDEDESNEDVNVLAAMFGEEIADDDEDDDDDDDEESPDSNRGLDPNQLLTKDRLHVQITPLSQATLPRTCYIVIDKFAELIVRPLKDFADLGQISGEETQQRTLPIFDNHRVAKRFSNQRTQRVIKVPDSRVFYKTTQHLKLKGITRLLVDGNIYSLN